MFREREASSVSVLRVLLGGRGALRQPLAGLAVALGAADYVRGACRGREPLLGSMRRARLRPRRIVRAARPVPLALPTVLPFAFSFEPRFLLAPRHARGAGAALTRAWIVREPACQR